MVSGLYWKSTTLGSGLKMSIPTSAPFTIRGLPGKLISLHLSFKTRRADRARPNVSSKRPCGRAARRLDPDCKRWRSSRIKRTEQYPARVGPELPHLAEVSEQRAALAEVYPAARVA